MGAKCVVLVTKPTYTSKGIVSSWKKLIISLDNVNELLREHCE
jgi:hypothetical protein